MRRLGQHAEEDFTRLCVIILSTPILPQQERTLVPIVTAGIPPQDFLHCFARRFRPLLVAALNASLGDLIERKVEKRVGDFGEITVIRQHQVVIACRPGKVPQEKLRVGQFESRHGLILR